MKYFTVGNPFTPYFSARSLLIVASTAARAPSIYKRHHQFIRIYDTANPDTANPDTANPDTANPDTANPDTANPDTVHSVTVSVVVMMSRPYLLILQLSGSLLIGRLHSLAMTTP